ncbi:pyrroloquinoline quinone precursor peptide PqqA [Streptomyces sp. GD-15H]
MAEHTEQAPPCPVEETGWQTPEFVIVETALEVTAYSLATR